MGKYFILAILLRAVVDCLILIVSLRLSKRQAPWWRVLLATLVAGAWSAFAALEHPFFKTGLWFLLGMIAVCFAAFGLQRGCLRTGLLYILMQIAMWGIASEGEKISGIFWALVLWSVWVYGFWYGKREKLLPVELSCNGKSAKLQGLVDTGNQLRDPITGRAVLVVGADVADQLIGLSRQQLLEPVESIGSVPGLRLIPYQTVGQSGGLMLATQIKDAKIGDWKGSALVAFSPRVLDEQGRYQALIGGMM